MQAKWHDQIIAESEMTRELQGYVYFPRDAVRMDLLTKAAKTASDLRCPHGVQFYDVAEAGRVSARAAWSYEAPQAAMQPVDHWIGFWHDVVVS